ncbi:MAG: recombinase family protein [Chloroflexota bacterium]
MIKKRCIIWTAVSSQRQADGVSLEHQQQECDRVVHDVIGGTVVATLRVSESRSANRQGEDYHSLEHAAQHVTGYRQLLEAINHATFDVLVYWDPDRLARAFGLGTNIVARCISANILLYPVTSPPLSLDPTDQKMDFGSLVSHSVRSSMSEIYIRQFTERTRVGMANRALDGWFPSNPPYGYMESRTAQKEDWIQYEFVPSERDALRVIKDWYLQNRTFSSIAEHMERCGYPTRLGKSWNKHTVITLLDRVWVYAGYVEYNKKSKREEIRAKGRWEPIFTDAEAREIERLRAERNTRRKGSQYNRLGKVLLCAECGYTMYAGRQFGRREDSPKRCYYYCPSLPERCDTWNKVYEEDIMADLTEVFEFMASVRDVSTLIDDSENTQLKERIKGKQKEIDEVSKRRKRLIDLHLDDLIDSDELKSRLGTIDNQSNMLRDELAKLEDEQVRTEDRGAKVERLEHVRDQGLDMLLDGDTTTCNKWLQAVVRARVRRVRDKQSGKWTGIVEEVIWL